MSFTSPALFMLHLRIQFLNTAPLFSQCVSLKSDWAKGYSRLGAAHFGLGQLEEAAKAYKDGEPPRV